jgi:hypothetical protein
MLYNMLMHAAENKDGDNPFEIRYLRPQRIRLLRAAPEDALVRLTIEGECSWRDVRISRSFPFSDPHHYIGLSDGNGVEIGQLRDLEGLDAETRRIIDEELERRYFTPKVEKVLSVKEEYGMVTWDVQTNRGTHRFIVRNIRDNTFPLGPNRLLMIDVDGNRFEFGNVGSYGSETYQVLAKVM